MDTGNIAGKQFIKKATIEVVEVQEDGILVQNSGKHDDRWVIPTDVFESTYSEVRTPTDNIPFGEAIEFIKLGHKVAREGWNGKDMFIYYVAANKYPMSNNLMETMAGRYEDDMVPYQAYIAFKTVDNTVVPWLASQTDILADDWRIV